MASHALHLHGSIIPHSPVLPHPPGLRRRLLPSSSVGSSKADDADVSLHHHHHSNSNSGKPQTLLVERYRDGMAKRYISDNDFGLQMFWEKDGSLVNIVQEEKHSYLSFAPSIFKDFVLPAGYPGSVSDDYLDYMLLQFPTNVTGWICHTLVTSSLLKAVGIGSSAATTAAASAAAIRWVSKDGLGAIGRLFIGGRFGNLFDDDPKQWRMYADFIGSAGSIFELTTQLYPAYFLPLASVGNLAKQAVARGLKDPSFRVIQNHFAISANLGEVAAKEEVWEVVAQLIGLTFGVIVLDTPGVQSSYSTLAFTWTSVRLLHLWLRYQSLSVLKFRTVNLKRARILVNSHVLYDTVPGYDNCNKEEDILSWERFLQPKVSFAVSMETMIGTRGSGQMVKELTKLYTKEKYILFVNQHGSNGLSFFVTFKEGASSLSVLRSLWQVYWLNENRERESECVFSWLEESLLKLESGFIDFLEQFERAGWKKDQIKLKVPKELLFEEVVYCELAKEV
ncbi:protein root UVB sensitive 5 isoform X1 [Typha latifolia]|uniref:protein root UVB sensitive 5 isoform X1 n=1 Tax=Typha latifolia TaxID=4733 RepID=UPI003C2CCE98